MQQSKFCKRIINKRFYLRRWAGEVFISEIFFYIKICFSSADWKDRQAADEIWNIFEKSLELINTQIMFTESSLVGPRSKKKKPEKVHRTSESTFLSRSRLQAEYVDVRKTSVLKWFRRNFSSHMENSISFLLKSFYRLCRVIELRARKSLNLFASSKGHKKLQHASTLARKSVFTWFTFVCMGMRKGRRNPSSCSYHW